MLDDLTDFLQDDGLPLPNVPSDTHPKGRTYIVPSPDADTGLWLERLAALGFSAASGAELNQAQMAQLQLNDEDERSFAERVLGSAFDEMCDDGVNSERINRLSHLVFIHRTMGEDAANAFIASQTGQGNRQARRAAAKSSRSLASRGAATTTKAQASTGGTTSPRKRAPRQRAAG